MVDIVSNKNLHRVVAQAVIYRKRDDRQIEYLILRRSPNLKVYPNLWALTGGGVEVDDYIGTPKTTGDSWYNVVETSLRREILEETKLEIGDIKYLCSLAFIRPDGIPVALLCYYAFCKSNDVQLNQEHTEFAWVTIDQVKNYDLIEGIEQEIKDVDKILRAR